MTYRIALSFAAVALSALAGCASRPEPVAVVAPPPPPAAPVAVAMPAGAYRGMVIPAVAPDGRYPTPNRDLSPAGTIWHLRAALNVAALACRGADEAVIIAGYNALLARERTALASAEAAYAGEYRATGGTDWRDRYDDAQTRLYNFFSQSWARDDFCRAAAATLTDAGYVDDASLPAFAAGRLAVLETPFTDFYRAYDAWRAQSVPAPVPVPAPAVVIASSATVPPGPAPARLPPAPRLQLDPSIFADASTASH